MFADKIGCDKIYSIPPAFSCDQIFKMVNKIRLEDKNQWYQVLAIVDGKEVKLKGYGTWLQIFKVDDIDHGCGADVSVKEFKNKLKEGIEYENRT